jgi:hypothetical protein
VFSGGSAPSLYNEDSWPAELEWRESPESAVGRVIEKRWQQDSWQLQQRTGLRVPEEIAGRQSCTRVGKGRA